MIFPKSEIFGVLTRKKSPEAYKAGLFWALLGVSMALGVFALLPFLKTVMPKQVARFIVYGGILGVFQYPFRKVIVKEDERMEEFLGRDSESFNKYLGIRNIDTLDFMEVQGYSVPVFELLNGTHRVYMEIRVGALDAQIAGATRRTYTNIFKMLGNGGFAVHDWTQREIFSETDEGQLLLKSINKIEDDKVRPVIAHIYQNSIDIADEMGNIPVMYLGISTTANFQKMELEGMLNRVLVEMNSRVTNIRRIKFLDGDEVLSVTKEYLDMTGIDPSKNIVSELIEKDLVTSIGVYAQLNKDGVYGRYPGEMEIQHQGRKIN